MDMTTENKSAAARFLADHEQLQNALESANLTLDDQRKEIERLDAMVSIQKDLLAQANTDKNTYLQYSFELSAQLQFIVSGSARALMIASQVRNAIAMKASNIPPVPGADIAELEDILHRIGEHNATANDGAGLTNDASDLPKPLTPDQFKAMMAAQADDTALPSGDPALPDNGTLVDRNGHPIMSDATRMMKTS